MRSRIEKALLSLVVLLFAVGLWHGYTRGGQDFRVFDTAARFVLEGQWSALYREGPDRFLYTPGFAILFSPISLFEPSVSHAIWLLLLTISFTLSMRMLSNRYGILPVSIAILFSMRSIWIDLRYGQVNLLILSVAIWALLSFSKPSSGTRSERLVFLSWMALGVAAISKLYPLALLAIPFFRFQKGKWERKNLLALGGATLGSVMVLALPFIFAQGEGSFLFREWLDALGRRGFPTDTHNQSFLAFLHRMFSGENFYSLTLGGVPLQMDIFTLSPSTIHAIGLVFSLGIAVFFIKSIRKMEDEDLSSFLALSLCFLPAHLIWKSYFLLALPLVALVAKGKYRNSVIVLGSLLVFCSNEFLSPVAAAWIEAGSVFLWAHLAIIVWATARPSS